MNKDQEKLTFYDDFHGYLKITVSKYHGDGLIEILRDYDVNSFGITKNDAKKIIELLTKILDEK